MNDNPKAKDNSWNEPDEALLDEFRKLWAEAEVLWDQHQEAPAFHGYVSSDFTAVYDQLNQLRGRVCTVLEWGSGLGVVTIMASRMGFEAYGIEAEAGLVQFSERLAEVYAPQARFAQGNFIPNDFQWDPASGDTVFRTMTDDVPAYDELDMELRDFDLIYAYPWPDEHVLFQNIVRECGRKEALLMTYDVREGIELVRFDGR